MTRSRVGSRSTTVVFRSTYVVPAAVPMIIDTIRPTTPTPMRIQPTVFTLNPLVWTDTANAKIAPAAMSNRLVPSPATRFTLAPPVRPGWVTGSPLPRDQVQETQLGSVARDHLVRFAFEVAFHRYEFDSVVTQGRVVGGAHAAYFDDGSSIVEADDEHVAHSTFGIGGSEQTRSRHPDVHEQCLAGSVRISVGV